MSKVYEYICKKCGVRAELDYGKEGTRHLVPSSKVKGNMVVCGTFRRAWASVTFNKVPGGGRG